MKTNDVLGTTSYTLFNTELGTCGIAWKESSRQNEKPQVISFQLPEATEQLTEARIVKKTTAHKTNTIPSSIGEIINRVKLHLKGQIQDFQDIDLDFKTTGQFAKQVYEAARTIPAGRTVTYGQLAEISGNPGAARAVGRVMGKNPIPIIIPCHRVLASGSKPGGFSAHGGLTTKMKMLDMEGVSLGDPSTIKSAKDIKKAAIQLAKKAPQFKHLISKPIDFEKDPGHTPYETLITAVVHQQLTPKAAKTILKRIMALYPRQKLPEAADLLKTPDEKLREAGLSRTKTKAVKDIATHVLDGTIPTSKEIVTLSNNEIIERLTSIYGVGRWTVEMMLIFNLGRMDVLPADDYSLRKGVANVYGMTAVPTPKEVYRLGEIWRPYRTIASLYLWNIKNNDNNNISKK